MVSVVPSAHGRGYNAGFYSWLHLSEIALLFSFSFFLFFFSVFKSLSVLLTPFVY